MSNQMECGTGSQRNLENTMFGYEIDYTHYEHPRHEDANCRNDDNYYRMQAHFKDGGLVELNWVDDGSDTVIFYNSRSEGNAYFPTLLQGEARELVAQFVEACNEIDLHDQEDKIEAVAKRLAAYCKRNVPE